MGKKLHHAAPHPNNINAKHISLSSHSLHFLITQHPFVEFLLHLIKKIGAAFVLPAFDIGVEAVAIFGFYTEIPVQKWSKLFEWHFTVVDATHLIDTVDKLHEIDYIPRPLQWRSYIFLWRVGIHMKVG